MAISVVAQKPDNMHVPYFEKLLGNNLVKNLEIEQSSSAWIRLACN